MQYPAFGADMGLMPIRTWLMHIWSIWHVVIGVDVVSREADVLTRPVATR
jgi:hypothetical protein